MDGKRRILTVIFFDFILVKFMGKAGDRNFFLMPMQQWYPGVL
jgi:hypothetical protein